MLFPNLVIPYSFVENDIIFNNLIWRNTKESIHDEYQVPDYEEKLIEIEFTPIEQLLHDHSSKFIVLNIIT